MIDFSKVFHFGYNLVSKRYCTHVANGYDEEIYVKVTNDKEEASGKFFFILVLCLLNATV